MKRFVYRDSMLEFLAATFKENSLEDTARLFNFAFGTSKTAKQIRSALKNHGITCDRPQGQLTKGALRSFSNDQRDWVTVNYPKMPLRELTAAFNATFGTEKTECQLRAFTRNHKILSGRTGQFKAGEKSWNAGIKGWCAGGNSISTRFKPGETPKNHRPVGSERVNVDGYIEVKVSEPNKWRLKQRVTWEQHHGPLKDGELVWFRDNDRLNCEIDNLMVVTRAQHAVVNKMGLHGATGDLKTTSVLIADLSMARTKRSKQPKVAA